MKKLALLTLIIIAFSANAQRPYDSLKINDIYAPVFPTFPQFFDPENQDSISLPAQYKVDSNGLIFVQNLWIGGKDLQDTQYLAAGSYSTNGNDFFYGPVSNNYQNDSIWNRTWKITKAEIDFHKANYWKPSYSAPSSIIDFPAHGKTSIGQASNLLPFIDNNQNGIYDPLNGDYPKIKGDEAIWFICNDDKAIHSESGGNAFGLEINGMYYAFDCPVDSALNQTVFCDLWITNRSSIDYYDVYIGNFVDMDISHAYDDYMGCDTLLNMFYGYDGITDSLHSYWVQSFMFLNQKMEYFISQINTGFDTTSPYLTNSTFNMYYYFPRGRFNDSLPISYKYAGLSDSLPIKYMFPGDPSESNQLSMLSSGILAFDRRGIASSGPYTFQSGDTIQLEFAMTAARDYGGTNLSSVTLLKQRVQDIITYYNNDSTPCGGSFTGLPPKVTFANINHEVNLFPNPANSSITIDWGNTAYPYNYEIINLIGQSVSKGTISNSGDKQISVSQLEEGIYILKMQSEDVVQTKKFVKKE